MLAAAVLLVLPLLPNQAFQVPPRSTRALELTATPAGNGPVQSTKSDGNGNTGTLNKLVGAAEMLLGLGIVAISTGAIALRGLRRLSARASKNSDIIVRQKAWLAPGSKVDLVGMYGVTEPCGSKGEYYWDPANLAENMNPKKLRFFRAAEIKHGRLCMLASLGWLVQEKVRIPWLGSEKAPNGFSALQYYLNLPRGTEEESGTATVASYVLISIVVACGYIERNASDEGRDPGDFDDPANWYAYNQELNKGGGGFNGSMEFFRDCEINHCRLAMVGILAAASAEYSSDSSNISQQWAGTGSFAIEYFKNFPIRVLPSYYFP